MKIAITGGAGFIGTNLAKLLIDEGYDVTLLDIEKSEDFPDRSVIADVTDLDTMTKALKGKDVIYHLAAEHRDDVRPIQKYYDVNVGGAENIVKAAEANDIQKIIFTSSVAVYPLVPADAKTGAKETDPPAPFNDYGTSKLQAEKVFEDWAKGYEGRSFTNVRLVATFGPRNRGNIYTLMNQIARGKFVMVGRGKNHKSVAYVGNVAAFLAHCSAAKHGMHLYNYADKPDLNMRDMVRDIRAAMGLNGLGPKVPYAFGLMGGMTFDLAARLTGKTFPISAIRVRKFCADTIVSAERLRDTGFKAPYSLRDGLREMIEVEFPALPNARDDEQTQKAA